MTEKYTKVYRELAKIPELKGARILSINNDHGIGHSCISIQVQWQGRDLVSFRQQASESHYLVYGNTVSAFPSVPTTSDAVLQNVSPSGRKLAQIIQNEEERKLLVTDSNGEMTCIDLKSRHLHGKVYCDPYISCLEWSSDERKIAFVAEEKRIHATNFYSPQPNKKSEEGRGEEHLFLEDWGEQMPGQHQGVIVIVNILNEDTTVVRLPGEVTPGQLVWRPNSDDVIGIAYPSKPYRIGIAYCSDRECFLFEIDEAGKYEELTTRGQHVKSPRFSSSGQKMIFLQSTTYGQRAPTAQLVLMTWPARKVELLLDYVKDFQEIKQHNTFAGVCGKSVVPKRCFDSVEKRVLFSAFKLSNYVMYLIDLESKEVTQLTFPNETSIVLDLHENWVLHLKSSVTEGDRLYLSKLELKADIIDSGTPVTPERSLKDIPKDWFQLWMFKSPIQDKEERTITLSALYVGPTKNISEGTGKRPLICWIHGGPHSLIGNRFSHMLAFFVSIGYSIVLPNYRGSVGHGNDFLTASLGQCGEADVQDCFQSIEECVRKFENVLDRNRIFLIGYSHGGLLALHLTSKYPNYFKAVAVTNPVSDIYIIAALSDIPELAFLEYGLPFTLGRSFDLEAVTRMFERSAISHVDKVKTPTIFLLGKNDLRVPPAQGLNYYRMLLARNVPTKVYMYNDDHSLKQISSESDYLIQIARWFSVMSSSRFGL